MGRAKSDRLAVNWLLDALAARQTKLWGISGYQNRFTAAAPGKYRAQYRGLSVQG